MGVTLKYALLFSGQGTAAQPMRADRRIRLTTMHDRQPVWLGLAGALVGVGGVLLAFDRVPLWVGLALWVAAAVIFCWLLIPPWWTDKRARRARAEELELEGRANQRQGLDEIATELGQISSQLKQELRWGKRTWGLFPNTAWAKNRHLVTEEGGRRAAVESAYAQAYQLSVVQRIATEEELSPEETEKRQRAKESVDAAAALIAELRAEVRL
jgi:hypothetical protein